MAIRRVYHRHRIPGPALLLAPFEPVSVISRPPALFQLNADALGAIQESLEMEAGQRIVGMQADQCGKRRHRRGITSLELSESFGILRDLWRLVGSCRQRL